MASLSTTNAQGHNLAVPPMLKDERDVQRDSCNYRKVTFLSLFVIVVAQL